MTSWDRFCAKVSPEPNTGCWLWTGATVRGYGQFWQGDRKILAHRFAYVNLVGLVPIGKELDHLCRVRCCCNPAHLEPVTRRENMLRAPANAPKDFWARDSIDRQAIARAVIAKMVGAEP